MTTTWASIRAGWSSAWQEMETRAYATYGATIEREPMFYATQVESFTRNLLAARTQLQTAFGHLSTLQQTDPTQYALYLPKYKALQNHYNSLAAGMWANSDAAEGTAPQAAAAPALPVVAIILGVGLTAVGVAWAVAYREYAVASKKETALFAAELEARVEASRDGRVLPPASIERVPPPSPPDSGWPSPEVALGALAVVAVAGGAVLYFRNR